MEIPDRTDAAIHEAAHAVACVLMRRWFRDVAIYKTSYANAEGRIVFRNLHANNIPKDRYRKKLWLERQIVIYLCGVVADAHLSFWNGEVSEGQNPPIINLFYLEGHPEEARHAFENGVDDDTCLALHLKHVCGISDDEFYELFLRSVHIFRTYERAISSVSVNLIRKKRLKYYEVRDIVRSFGYL